MIENLINKIEKGTVRYLLYTCLISCFWAVCFYLFTPCIFIEPYHIQFFIIFAPSFLSVVLYFPIFLYTEAFLQPLVREFSKDITRFRLEFYLSALVVLKSIYILVGVYYDMDITEYLKLYFRVTGIWILVLVCYRIYYARKKYTRSNN